MEKKLWFKAKKYGYGWVPITWEGWGVLALYVLLLVWLMRGIEQSKEAMIYFLVKILILNSVLIFVAYKKGEKPGWRWGRE